jgi:predicted hydrocarbon binding protein
MFAAFIKEALMTLKTAKVPKQMEPLFTEAEKYVNEYFNTMKRDPEHGTIEIAGERYILVRASSMSVFFLEHVKTMYPGFEDINAVEAAATVLFDIAHTIGKNDAKCFHDKTKVEDPIAKLSTGPIHFSHVGWAYVDILPESKPSPDENYYLIYDHPYSFESESWIKERGEASFCTCFMNAGYSSGWCEASFGIQLVAREILCRAKGDAYCRFIMSQPHRIDEFCKKYRKERPELFE